jgi:hypothetical protein
VTGSFSHKLDGYSDGSPHPRWLQSCRLAAAKFSTSFRTVFELFSNCFRTVFELFSDNFRAVFGQFSNCFRTVFEQFLAIFRQNSDNFRAVFDQFLTSFELFSNRDRTLKLLFPIKTFPAIVSVTNYVRLYTYFIIL